MSTKALSSIAEDYFYNLNPLAKRIGDDVKATKEAYEGLWNTLSLKEKNQAIDETIIQPEIALKYTTLGTDKNKEIYDCYPKLRIQTGTKYVIDETGSTLKWKDEHSGPFSFMTQSQMNLHLLELPSEITKIKVPGDYADKSPHFLSPIKINDSSFDSSSNDYSPTSTQVSFYQSESFSDSVYSNVDSSRLNNSATIDNTGNIFTKLINKTSLLKINHPIDDLESLVPQKQIIISKNSGGKNANSNGNGNGNGNGNKNQMNINLNNRSKSDASESTALLETPSSYNSFQFLQSNQEDEIPKTGFEFLDNW